MSFPHCAVLLLAVVVVPATSLRAQINATWVGTVGGPPSNWSLATNWSTNPQVPNGAMDSATLTNAQTTLNIGVTLQDLTLNGNASLFSVAGSPQTLAVEGNFMLLGAQSGSIASGVTLSIEGTGTANRSGTYSLNGTLNVAASKTFIHSGTGALAVFSGGVINNAGTWQANGPGGIAGGVGSGIFKNLAGATFKTTGTTFDYPVARTFSNAGDLLVEATAVSLLLNGGGILGGTVIVGADSGGLFLGSVSSVPFDALIKIFGFVQVSLGATLSLDADLTFTGGSSPSLPGELRLAGSGSSVATLSIPAGHFATFTGVRLNLVSAGVVSGGTSEISSVLVNGSSQLVNHVLKLQSGGTLFHTGAAQFSFTNSSLENAGTYFANGNGFLLATGVCRLGNTGTFRRTTSSGVFQMSVRLDNDGLVDVQTGTLLLNGGGTSVTVPNPSATFTIASGATLRFGANYTFNAGTDVSGAGTLDFRSGTMTFTDSFTWGVSNVAFTGATISVPAGKFLAFPNAAFLTSGTTTFTGGGVIATRNGSVDTGATVALDPNTTVKNDDGTQIFLGAGRLNFNGGTYRNEGTTRFNGTGGANGSPGTFANPPPGLLDIDSPGNTVRIFITFDSTGQVQVGPGSTFQLSGPWAQNSGGTMTGGSIKILGGFVQSGPPITTIGPGASVQLGGSGSFPSLGGANNIQGTLDLSPSMQPFPGGTPFQIAPGGIVKIGPGLGNRAARPAGGAGPLTEGFGGAGSTISNSGLLSGLGTVNGTFTNNAGGVVSATGAGTLTFTGCVTNNGTIIVAGGAALVFTSNCFTNNGVIQILGGSFTPPPGFVNNGQIYDASVVQISNVTKNGATSTLTVNGVTGRMYQLQRSLALESDQFTNIGSPQAGMTGSPLTFIDPGASGAKGFYRMLSF